MMISGAQLLAVILFTLIVSNLNCNAWGDTPEPERGKCLIALGEGLKAGGPNYFDTLSKYSFFYMDKTQLYPDTLGSVTAIATDLSYPGRVIAATSSKGAIISYRPPQTTDRKIYKNGLVDKFSKAKKREIERAPGEATLRQVFSSPNTVISQILLEAGQRKSSFLVSSNKGLKIALDNGALFDIPFGHLSVGSGISNAGIVVNFQDHTTLYSLLERDLNGEKYLAVKKEIKLPAPITMAAVSSRTGTSVVLSGTELFTVEVEGEVQKFATLDLSKKEKVLQIQWNDIDNYFFVRTNSRIFIFNKQTATQIAALKLNSDLASIAWEPAGQYLAVSTATDSFVYEIANKRVIPIENIGFYAQHRLHWLGRDGILGTIVKSVDTSEKAIWKVEFWDPRTGQKLHPDVELDVENPLESTPYLVGETGRMIDGSFEFGVLSATGQLSRYRQVLNENFIKPLESSIIILN